MLRKFYSWFIQGLHCAIILEMQKSFIKLKLNVHYIEERKGMRNHMHKFKYGLLIATVCIVLAGCSSGSSTEEKVFDVLEETYALEQPYVEQQAKIATLEQEEKEIFDEITALSSDQMEEIQALAQQAIVGIENREELIAVERESMTDSQEEFEKIHSLIDELEEEQAKETAKQVVETMNNRFNEYDALHTAYVAVLQMEKELYALFENEDTEKAQVTDTIIELNEKYEEIMALNQTFNEYTATYNEQKKTFYDTAELNVTFEES